MFYLVKYESKADEPVLDMIGPFSDYDDAVYFRTDQFKKLRDKFNTESGYPDIRFKIVKLTPPEDYLKKPTSLW